MPADAWFIYAFDHRNSYRGMLRRAAGRDDRDLAIATKGLLFDGFREAVTAGPPIAGAAVLLDEEYGLGFARPALDIGAEVIIPVERSGQLELQLEYGADFGAHVEAFAPTAVKILLRWDPAGDAELNARQGRLLAEVCTWLAAREIPAIAEVLTPEDRPPGERTDAIVAAIGQIIAAGAEPDLWKVEGINTTAGCREVAAAAAVAARPSRMIVLGRGVALDVAEQWLVAAAPVPAFAGFAIGKTLWQEPMEAHLRGDVRRADATAEIARRYRRLVDVWTSTRAAAG